MYVLPCDIHTKLQLFYFTAKYFMLKFFQSSRQACFWGKEQGARGKSIALYLFPSVSSLLSLYHHFSFYSLCLSLPPP